MPARIVARPLNFLRRHARGIGKLLVILAVIAVSWVPAFVVNNVMGYAPGFFVTLGIAFSGLYLLALRRSFEYAEASRVNRCIRGENVDFVLRLHNKFVLLFPRVEVVFYQSDLFGGEDRVSSRDVILAPFATKDFTFQMRFDHLGVYSAGLRRVVLHDLLGLFSFTHENDNPQRIEVLPRGKQISNVTFSSESPTQSTSALKTVLDEGMDYSMVREYRWGDPIKSIHWKLSARLDYYVTRVYESNADPGLTTVVDLHAQNADPSVLMQLYDAVVESALSLNEFAVQQGLDSALVYMDDAGTRKRYEERLEEEGVRKLVGLLRADSSQFQGDACSLLREELNSPYSQSNIALCTSALDDALIEALLSIKMRHKNPILLLAIPEHLDKEERRELLAPLRRLDQAHVAYCAFTSVDDLATGGIAA